MKTIWKLAGFAGGFIAVMALLFEGFFSLHLEEYVADRDARTVEIWDEEPGQIDVLNVGDSLCDDSISPPELYRDYGITCYNMGRDLQRPIETYYAIKTAVQRQPIKVVLWEVHNLVKRQPALELCEQELVEGVKYRFPVIRYHSVWKNVLEGKKHQKYFKGFLVREDEQAYTGNEFYQMDDRRMFAFTPDQMHAFKKIYELCRRKGIKLVLYSAPSPDCYTMKIHNGFARLAREYGLDYVDANMVLDELGIDWTEDTFDEGDHLNLFGAQKMTRFMGEFLAAACRRESDRASERKLGHGLALPRESEPSLDLVDHRGDEEFHEWDEAVEEYEREVEKLQRLEAERTGAA